MENKNITLSSVGLSKGVVYATYEYTYSLEVIDKINIEQLLFLDKPTHPSGIGLLNVIITNHTNQDVFQITEVFEGSYYILNSNPRCGIYPYVIEEVEHLHELPEVLLGFIK